MALPNLGAGLLPFINLLFYEASPVDLKNVAQFQKNSSGLAMLRREIDFLAEQTVFSFNLNTPIDQFILGHVVY